MSYSRFFVVWTRSCTQRCVFPSFIHACFISTSHTSWWEPNFHWIDVQQECLVICSNKVRSHACESNAIAENSSIEVVPLHPSSRRASLCSAYNIGGDVTTVPVSSERDESQSIGRLTSLSFTTITYYSSEESSMSGPSHIPSTGKLTAVHSREKLLTNERIEAEQQEESEQTGDSSWKGVLCDNWLSHRRENICVYEIYAERCTVYTQVVMTQRIHHVFGMSRKLSLSKVIDVCDCSFLILHIFSWVQYDTYSRYRSCIQDMNDFSYWYLRELHFQVKMWLQIWILMKIKNYLSFIFLYLQLSEKNSKRDLW